MPSTNPPAASGAAGSGSLFMHACLELQSLRVSTQLRVIPSHSPPLSHPYSYPPFSDVLQSGTFLLNGGATAMVAIISPIEVWDEAVTV